MKKKNSASKSIETLEDYLERLKKYNQQVYICGERNSYSKTDHIRHSKSKTGYVSEKTIYKCEDCSGCPYKSECIKGNNCKTPMEERTKMLHVAKTFLKQRIYSH